MLNFTIEIKSGAPIYEQIVYATKKAIVSGQLRAGDKFPSVRELSKELKVNPNTVQKAVSHLVNESLLEIKPGIGSVVSQASEANEMQKQKILKSEIERLVVEAKRLSIEKDQLHDAIEQHWSHKKGHSDE